MTDDKGHASLATRPGRMHVDIRVAAPSTGNFFMAMCRRRSKSDPPVSFRSAPTDLKGRVVYYVGPVDAVAGEAVGPASPTTATRMDKFVELVLAQTGLLAMIGKAERGPEAIESIRRHGAAYLVAVGGAAYLLSKAIRSSRIVAFEDLGMEAIHEYELKDFPVTVAVDSKGRSIHRFAQDPVVATSAAKL